MVRDHYPAHRQLSLQSVQRQMRLGGEPLDNELTVRFQHGPAVTTHLAGQYRARRPVAPRPLHHRGHRHAEPGRHSPAALAARNSHHNTLTKIVR
jgi:hypothetical protein